MNTPHSSRAKTVTQRVIFGTLALMVVFVVVWLDGRIATHYAERSGRLASTLCRGSLLPLFILGMILMGGVEMLRLWRAKGAKPFSRCSLVVIGSLVLLPWLTADVSQHAPGVLLVLGVAVTVLVAGMITIARRQPEHSLRDLGATLTTVIYLGFLGWFATDVRSNLTGPGADGAWLLLALVLITKASDIGAYFTGTFLGRHPLIPAVSPGKSVEGMIGGLIMSGIVAWALVAWTPIGAMPVFADWGVATSRVRESMAPPGAVFPLARSLVAFGFGLALSAAGQIGDLLESCFKRDAGIKDSGHVIPRFGGILDLIDSPLMAIPIGWLILTTSG